MNIRNLGWRRVTGALLALSLLGSPAHVAFAEGQADLAVEIGWDGSFKETAWTPVRVNVKNEGADLTGRLVIGVNGNGNNYGIPVTGTIEKEVTVPKGGTKEVTLLVPGLMFRNTVSVQLFDEDNKLVEEEKNIVRTPLNETLLVGGMTAKADDLNLFSLIPQQSVGGKVSVKHVEGDDLPERPELLNGLDLLVVNHAPQDELTQAQIEAVRVWVSDGGKLLLSGGPNYNGGASLFQELSPVQVTGTAEVTDLSRLQGYAGVPMTVDRLTVSTGTPTADAHVLVRSGEVPLLAERRFGTGHVLYAAYDLSEEPLASWQGNKELWSKMFAEADVEVLKTSSQYHHMDPMNAMHTLIGGSAMFRTLIPSINSILIMFGIYLVLIGPILYFLLRRLNKREWGWAAIPGTALAFSLGIYLVGADPRAGAIGQFISQIELKTDETATVKGAGSFIVTRGGDYQVNLSPGTLGFAGQSWNTSQGGASAYSRVVQGGEQQQVFYENVEYFTTRSAYVEGRLENVGRVESDLQITKAGTLAGTLTNKTDFDLESVYLLVGVSPVEIGELKAGQSVQVDEKLSSVTTAPTQFGTDYLVNKMVPMNYGPFGNADQPDDQLKRNLLQYSTAPMNMGHATIQLYAFTYKPLDLYEIEGVKIGEDKYVSLVKQEIELMYKEDATSMPVGLIRGQVIEQKGNVGFPPEGLHIMDGSVTLQYNVKLSERFVPEKVSTDLHKSIYAPYKRELFNWQTQAFEEVSDATVKEMTGDTLKKYISEDGRLNVRLNAASGPYNGALLPYPGVGVEGKVAQ